MTEADQAVLRMLRLDLPLAPVPVQLIGDPQSTAEALRGVPVADTGVAVVAEGSLDQATGEEVRRRLAAGVVVVMLAQPESAAAHYPVPLELHAIGPSVLHFTTGHGALPSFPPRNPVASAVQALSVVARVGGGAFADTPVVIADEPVPGTVVGSHQVGPGRLVFCQYRLGPAAAKGDAAARTMLADLLRWASQPRSALVAEESRLADGRKVARYSHTRAIGR